MKQKHLVLVFACISILILIAVSACIGSYPLSPAEILDILCGRISDTMSSRVFWQLRLPRVLMGVAAGAALGLSGAIYQTIFRNPLASPDLTGVASGASFGAACAIVLGAGSGMEIMTGSFLMGIVSLVLVLFLVRASRFQQTGSYILAGIIVSSLADAGLMILKIMADPERELPAIEFWTMGSLADMTAGKLFPQILCILLPLALMLLCNRQTIILSMGSEHARSVGLDPTLWRIVFLGLTTFMISAVVSITGVIAFVGLIAPHIAFLLLKRRDWSYFYLSTLFGSVLLLIADIFARSLSNGAELPLSILTVFLAVPLLIFLLCGRKGGSHDSII